MITFLKVPALFTTLNLALFEIASDRPTIIQFKVEVLDGLSGDVMGFQRYAVNPLTALGTYFDLAPLLSAFVDYDILINGDILEETDKTNRAYKINVIEEYLDEDGFKQVGDALESSVFNIYNATINRVDFSEYDYKKYVFSPDFPGTKFQSLRPLVSPIYYDSLTFLYFMANDSFKVRFKFYEKGNVLVGTFDIEKTIDVLKSFRLNISPVALASQFGEALLASYGHVFNSVFTAPFNAGILHTVGGMSYFTVELVSIAGEVISETRAYTMNAALCETHLNLLFTNNLGGVDTMQFTGLKQTVSSSKTTIDANPFQYIPGLGYSDINSQGVFNQSKKVIASETSNGFTAVSQPLNDELSVCASALIESDNVYIKLSSGKLLPVTVDKQDYNISRRKHTTENVRLAIAFKIEDYNLHLEHII